MLGGRRVHYRECGNGPPMMMLHQSPRSSRECEPLMDHFALRFTVIAPDTPGYGLSDPIAPPDEDPNIDRFVDAIAELIDALGTGPLPVYGTHTGGILAVRLAARYPELVTGVAANGIMIMSTAERCDMLREYTTRFLPRWDGGHLAWLWTRLTDQTRYFPWYRRTREAAIEWRTNPAELHDGIIDMLQAGDNYRAAYRAVMDYRIERDLERLVVPTRIIMAASDALSIYEDRFPPLPPAVKVTKVAGFDEAHSAAFDHLAGLPAGERMTLTNPPAPKRGLASAMTDVSGGTLHVRGRLSGKGLPVLVLHGLGASAAVIEPLLGAIDSERPVIAPDLPGHGESQPCSNITIDSLAAAIAELLETLDITHTDCIAFDGAAVIAQALARLKPDLLATLSVCDPIDTLDELRGFLPPQEATKPDGNGLYLQHLWGFVRERRLSQPWLDMPTDDPLSEPPSPLVVARRLLAALQSGEGARALADGIAAYHQTQIPFDLPITLYRTNELPDDLRDWPPIVLGG